ncbi:hypothetical protein VIGAN_06037200 [Vigna angularis var. angularis]|uniref:Uncharacterized protein n=1 Tax=Vigna angularis var. angularis TaxID=157739 RepID=A0A0S3S9D7_PHAAN|nr:hypothetical protein VIGAN_06037200 [Vigna angularis var. angularis]
MLNSEARERVQSSQARISALGDQVMINSEAKEGSQSTQTVIPRSEDPIILTSAKNSYVVNSHANVPPLCTGKPTNPQRIENLMTG